MTFLTYINCININHLNIASSRIRSKNQKDFIMDPFPKNINCKITI